MSQLQRSSLSFVFEPETMNGKIERAKRQMINKVKKFGDISKEVKRISNYLSFNCLETDINKYTDHDYSKARFKKLEDKIDRILEGIQFYF